MGANFAAMAQGVRQRIFPTKVYGELEVWYPNSKFGFIRPQKPLNHPDAGKHGGKIYLHINDILGKPLSKGSKVEFFVYRDQSGLGAERCQISGSSAPAVSPRPPVQPPANAVVQAHKATIAKIGPASTNAARPTTSGFHAPMPKWAPKPGAQKGGIVQKTIQKTIVTPVVPASAAAKAGKIVGINGRLASPFSTAGVAAPASAAGKLFDFFAGKGVGKSGKIPGPKGNLVPADKAALAGKIVGKTIPQAPAAAAKVADRGEEKALPKALPRAALAGKIVSKPTPEASAAAASATKVICPKKCGQPLKQAPVPSSGASCDACGKPAKSGTSLYSCRPCNFDMCIGCSKTEAAKTPKIPGSIVKGKGKVVASSQAGKGTEAASGKCAAKSKGSGKAATASPQTAAASKPSFGGFGQKILPGRFSLRKVDSHSPQPAKGSKGGAKGVAKGSASSGSIPVKKTIVKPGSNDGKGAKPFIKAAQKPLPPNWEEHMSDEHGVSYYWNRVTKESVWVRPAK